MSNSPIHPGATASAREKPGIYLKVIQDSPWTGAIESLPMKENHREGDTRSTCSELVPIG